MVAAAVPVGPPRGVSSGDRHRTFLVGGTDGLLGGSSADEQPGWLAWYSPAGPRIGKRLVAETGNLSGPAISSRAWN